MAASENVCDLIVKRAFGSFSARNVVLIGSRHHVNPSPKSSIDRCFDTLAEFGACEAQTVIITDALDHEPPARLASTLATLRNRLIPRIVFLPLEESVSSLERPLRGLGFVMHGVHGNRQIWAYALSSDNLTREWNNPDNWANPENFDTRRW